MATQGPSRAEGSGMKGYKQVATKDFNFVIAKISVTTEITEFREIQPKFRRNFFRD
jgi:hypothetical protein